MNRYKKVQMLVIGLAFMALGSACGHRNQTIIETNADGNKKRIEYSGQVVFSQDRTTIDHISEGGYVKFERNGKTIEAENDGKGKVVYVYNGGYGTTALDADGKLFLSEAVKEIIREKEKLEAGK